MTLLAAFSGAFYIHNTAIIIVSALITFFVVKKYPLKEKIPLIVWLTAGLLLVLLVYPILLTSGVAASADGVTTISMRIFALHHHIPETYLPYTNLSFTYQIGFPLLASVLHSLFSWIPDYQFSWMLGSIFGAFLPIIIYLFSRHFFDSEWVGITGSFLVLGSKLVFENFYWGEYAWLAATIFVFLGLLLLKQKNPIGFFCVGMIATLHPAILINFFILLFFLVLFGQIQLKQAVLGAVVGFVLALPALYYNYLPIFTNLIGGKGSHAGNALISNVLALPPWIGLGLSFLIVIAVGFTALSKTRVSIPRWLLFLVLFSLIFFAALSFIGTQYANRQIELVTLSLLFLSAILISKLRWFHSHRRSIFIFILVVGLVSFSVSGLLIKSRAGSKINADEIALAKAFFEIDNQVKPTIFLTYGGGKMAEIANKKPFDASSGQIVTVSEVLIIRNEAWEEFEKNRLIQEEIRKTNCASCILELPGLEYAVIDETYTTIVLPKPIIAKKGTITIYALRD